MHAFWKLTVTELKLVVREPWPSSSSWRSP